MNKEEKASINHLENFMNRIRTESYLPEAEIALDDSIEDVLYLIENQQQEIEDLKKDNENQWRHRCKMAIELDNNVVRKDKIREILNQYGKKEIEYALDFYKEIEKLLEE